MTERKNDLIAYTVLLIYRDSAGNRFQNVFVTAQVNRLVFGLVNECKIRNPPRT